MLMGMASISSINQLKPQITKHYTKNNLSGFDLKIILKYNYLK